MKIVKLTIIIALLYATIPMYGMYQQNQNDPFNIAGLDGVIAHSPNVTPQKKLDNLIGDHLWHIRKSIIKKLIDTQGLKPDTITYQAPATITPMTDAIAARDAIFIAYLIQNGASPNKAALEILKGGVAVSYFHK